MSIDSKLYINQRFDERDIRDILTNHIGAINVKTVTSSATPEMLIIYFTLNGKNRMMFYHLKSETPLGIVGLLSLSSNDQTKEIFTKIANVIGGFFIHEDTNDNGKMIYGMAFEEDGLPWFIKQAMVQGEMKDNDDLTGLSRFIEKWNEYHKRY